MIGFFKLDPWKDKTALIMGVNSALGVAIAKKLLKMQMTVVGADTDEDHLEDLQKLEKFQYIKADLKNYDDIIDVFLTVEGMGGADLLVNNIEVFAGITFLDGSMTEWKDLINKYILGVNLNIREIIRSMIDRNIELGQIVNVLNFSAGQVSKKSHLSLYHALKIMVNSLTKYMRQELDLQDNIMRISSISSVFENPTEEKQCNTVKPCAFADAVEHVISAPFHIQIRDIVLEAI